MTFFLTFSNSVPISSAKKNSGLEVFRVCLHFVSKKNLLNHGLSENLTASIFLVLRFHQTVQSYDWKYRIFENSFWNRVKIEIWMWLWKGVGLMVYSLACYGEMIKMGSIIKKEKEVTVSCSNMLHWKNFAYINWRNN